MTILIILWQVQNKEKNYKAYSKELAFVLVRYTGKEWTTTRKMLINSFWIDDNYYCLNKHPKIIKNGDSSNFSLWLKIAQ